MIYFKEELVIFSRKLCYQVLHMTKKQGGILMGGSGNGYGGGGGAGPTESCGRTVTFLIVINNDEETIWASTMVGQLVNIAAIQGSIPKLEIRLTNNDFLLGLVPGNYSWLLGCIQKGWRYDGKITQKSGNELNPQLTVEVTGTI